MPVEMTRARFEELVADALDLIPRKFTAAMNNVVVLVEDIDPDNDHLLGLYHGVALTSRTSHYAGVLPDRITIFRIPILRMCHSEEQVVRQVGITVVHEVGHHFGIDDATLHELGWG
jgi:predicted Zn-dependent protease with MMP-like domain